MAENEAIHPGEILRGVARDKGLTIAGFARALGVSRQQIYYLIRGDVRFTAPMAVRVERAFGQSAEHLMRLQTQRDLDEARRSSAEVPDAYPPSRRQASSG